jgi:nitrogen fixation protein FixH
MAEVQNRKLTGRGVIIWLIATFGVVLAVNFYFIYQAEKTYPGQDVSHPYLQGIDYNQTLAARAKQEKLGWSATIGGMLAKDGTATITVTIRDKAGKPVSGEALTGLLRHPMDEELDRKITLREVGAGTYVGHLDHVRVGRWDVVVKRKTTKEAPFEAERRLWLR